MPRKVADAKGGMHPSTWVSAFLTVLPFFCSTDYLMEGFITPIRLRYKFQLSLDRFDLPTTQNAA